MTKTRSIILLVFTIISINSFALSPDYSSPESVIETFYNAIKERNLEVLAECIHPDSQQREAVKYHSRNTSDSELAMYEKRLGEWGSVYSVDYENPYSSKGWVKVKVEFYKETGETHFITIYVKEYDMGFRIIQI